MIDALNKRPSFLESRVHLSRAKRPLDPGNIFEARSLQLMITRPSYFRTYLSRVREASLRFYR